MSAMRVADAFRKSRPRLSAEVAALAALLSDDPVRGVAAVPPVMDSVCESASPADVRLAALESLRVALIERIDPTMGPLRGQPIPLLQAELASVHRLTMAVHAMRDAFKRVYADLCEAGSGDAPGLAPPPRAMLALARALDLQSRMLVATACARIATERAQWDELCRLAYPLWRLSAIDEAFPEPSTDGEPRRRGDTPRSALALPLLMRLLEPLGLSTAELDLAHCLAQGAARRAGVRIDLDGQPHVNPDGPALMLSPHHTVQVDTRSMAAALKRCMTRLAAGEPPAALGLHTTLSASQLAAVLPRLREVWGAMHVPTPLVRPPVVQALLHAGLPQRVRPACVEGAAVASDAGETPGSRIYVYGRGAAGNGPVRSSGVPGLSAAPDAPTAASDAARELLLVAGETVLWRGRDARRAVFARTAGLPRLRLGMLVAVLPRHPGEAAGATHHPRPGSGPTRVLLGRVVTLSQTGCADARQPFGHDVGIVFWPGAPQLVRIQPDGATGYEDAWLLPATADGAPPSLVLRRDLFEAPLDVAVRGPGIDRDWRMTGLLEQGPDHDRVGLARIR
jgi:hypothetical protein